MENKLTINEIFKRLIGYIDSYGETNHDNESLKNLECCHDLINHVVQELNDNVATIANHQFSMQEVAKKSYEILVDIKELSSGGIDTYKRLLYKDDYSFPKFKKIDELPHIYVIDDDTIVSPFSKEYTLEWYQKNFDDSFDKIEEIKLFRLELPNQNLVPCYSKDSKEVQFWDQATPDEIKYLGTNMLIQPNVSEVGTIRNYYGDICTLRTFYDVLDKYVNLEEPQILCSKNF